MGNIPVEWLLAGGATLVSALLGLIAWMLARWLDGMRTDIQALQSSDGLLSAQVHGLREELPREYVRRDDFSTSANRIEASVSALRDEVRNGFERVYDKLEAKQDKT